MATIKHLLEGRPLRHPLHPALVHLPIGLFPLGVLLDVASWAVGRPELNLVRAAFASIALGLVTAIAAALAGIVDYTDIRTDHPAKKIATRHFALNILAVVLFAAGAWLRIDSLGASRTPPLPLALSVVALAVLSYSGYLGGRIVYDDGVAVGRHRRRTRMPDTTKKARGPGGWVAVADERALQDGQTIRADVNGTVVAIARLEGHLYAFQEFCTHRFGPLSEGCFDGCEVVCPWHRSRFDVRTGKVTGGPAKVDLRHFRVECRNGKICVEAPKKAP